MQNRQSRCRFALDMFQNIFAFLTYLHTGNIHNIRKCRDFLNKTVIITGGKEETRLKSQLGPFYQVGQKMLRLKILDPESPKIVYPRKDDFVLLNNIRRIRLISIIFFLRKNK